MGIGEAEDIGVKDEFCPSPGAHRVAVDADYAGEGPTIGVEGGRGVVRFHLHHQVPVIVEPYHTGVVLEHGNEPGLSDLGRGSLDVGLE